MKSIEFNYMYRDSGNYKNYGKVYFINSLIDLTKIQDEISSLLIDGIYFSAESIGIPTLYFQEFGYDPELDHSLHEFISIEYSEFPPTESLTITDFVDKLKILNNKVII